MTNLTGHENPDLSSAMNTDCPVDHDHLARYTLANQELEREVLELFQEHSARYLTRLKEVDSEKGWADAAHTIKGSARGIGAWRVARCAEAAEKLNGNLHQADRLAAIRELESAIGEVNRYISSILPGNIGRKNSDAATGA